MRPHAAILSNQLVDQILDQAMDILATRGVQIDDRECFDRLVDAGLTGAPDQRLLMPRAAVEKAIEQAPASIELFDRDGASHARLEKDQVHFTPASSALRILDHRTEQIREPTTGDFVEYVRVADQLKNLSYLSTAFVTHDVPQDLADAWRLYLVLSQSKSPVVTGAFTPDGVPRMVRIMEMFRSDLDDLIERPMAIFTCCPNTPLRWGDDSINNLIDCAEAGVPVEVVPVLLLGMISPATPVGALVLHTAEVLSGLTIAQTIRPGSPILFGGAPASFHMKLMTNPMTAVEALQIYCGYAQIAKRLDVPCQAYMALSDSKFNDLQAGAETGVGAFLAALWGFNSVSGPGMLDYVNCFSLEKLVFDDEMVAHAQRFIRPIEIKDDLPTGELIDELLENKHLMMSEHTLQHWQDELYIPGPMVDRTNWDQWENAGEPHFRDSAGEIIDEALDDYDTEPIDDKIHFEIHQLFRETAIDEGLVLPKLDAIRTLK